MNEDYGSQISKFRHQTGYCKRHSVDAGKYLRRMSQHSHEPDSVFVLQVADLISSDTRINQVLYFQLVSIWPKKKIPARTIIRVQFFAP
jgi:hypothetical protein